MGTGRRRRGVEVRENSIRVHFTWNGTRCRETLDLAPTVAHADHAAKLVDKIVSKIKLGEFTEDDYAEAFPRSEIAKRLATAAREAKPDTFGVYVQAFIDARCCESNVDLAAATKSQYANELKRWKKRIGADKPMADIKHSWLAGVVGKVKFPSAKMRNNSLIPLRGTFDLWVADDRLRRSSPMEGIENATIQKAKPDPFDWDEAELIMADLRKHAPLLVALYFVFMFNTGLRPEEGIALRWDHIDWRRRRVLIDTVRTFKGTQQEVKTKKPRWVDCRPQAMVALRELRALTELKSHEHVFENPVTSRPWHDERSQRDHYWKPCLRRLRLRYRDPYRTRATRATNMLMRGMNPAYCAAQLGHSKREFFETYADWIELAERYNDRERAKDEAEIAAMEEEKSA